jgi:hypothetical protein
MNNIKKIKPTLKSGFKQSYFQPTNIQKYVGEFPIICRSSWEKKFAIFCDTNPAIIKWSSEPIEVKYYNILDKKMHKYYPDYFIIVKRGDIEEKCLVEIKPSSQLKKPEVPKKLTEKAVTNFKHAYNTYVKNLCKIEALEKFAIDRAMKVLIITENSKLI